jgi:ubiquinol-cytochrome c reductase cytochrome c1 subunit
MFERPGKLSDHFPAPYKNEEHARSINNGAYPPDLSLINKSRGKHEDYIFALLTGYREVPSGVVVNEAGGQYYNPYFPGGKIGMAKQLNDGMVDYPDGTPATASQMAKDVAVFLAWAAEPDEDERKRIGMKWFAACFGMAALSGYYKRWRWAPIKTRKLTYTD